MADEEPEGEEDAPAVELGEGATVEGVPLARVASRLTWPLERSEVARKAGDVDIRTPAGPQALSAVLEEVDTSYFATRQAFLSAVRAVVGVGPVPSE